MIVNYKDLVPGKFYYGAGESIFLFESIIEDSNKVFGRLGFFHGYSMFYYGHCTYTTNKTFILL